MNNLTIGSRGGGGSTGGDDPTPSFTYYETIGGGFGARPDADGMDGVQVGMTNTLNTPVEALEAAYPIAAMMRAATSATANSPASANARANPPIPTAFAQRSRSVR